MINFQIEKQGFLQLIFSNNGIERIYVNRGESSLNEGFSKIIPLTLVNVFRSIHTAARQAAHLKQTKLFK